MLIDCVERFPYICGMEWTREKIRLLRQHLGDSADKMGERCGVGRSAVYLWESGERVPSDTAKRLLDYIADEHGFTDGIARKMKRSDRKGG